MTTSQLIAKYQAGELSEDDFLAECCKLRASLSLTPLRLITDLEMEALLCPPRLSENAGDYTVEVDFEAGRGYFEHMEYGEDSAGGLWVSKVNGSWTLTEYDGVFMLPADVKRILIDNNVNVED
jgi:hypothetical protein